MKKLESIIKEYLIEYGWDNQRPSDIAKSISIESAELLEHFQWQSLTIQETLDDKKKTEEIKKELADVLIYCIEMSVLLKFDTEEIITKKLASIKEKYPPDIIREGVNSDSGSGCDPNYLAIKKEHRSKS